MITVAMTTREANCEPAPINHSTEPRLATVYLSLGTNLGDREANLREAIRQITALGLTITRRSSIYETEPVGFADQDWFLNQVIEAQMPCPLMVEWREEDGAVSLAAGAKTPLTEQLVLLLDALLTVESAMGRRRLESNGPRVIDIDILLCGEITGVFGKPQKRETNHEQRLIQRRDNETLPELILPHPRLHLRRFVLAPLCEIAPAVLHPALRKTCQELLAALKDSAIVRMYRKIG